MRNCVNLSSRRKNWLLFTAAFFLFFRPLLTFVYLRSGERLGVDRGRFFRIIEEHQNSIKQQMEDLRTTLQKKLDEKVAKEQKEAEERHQQELHKCRELWEAQKEEEVEALREEMVSSVGNSGKKMVVSLVGNWEENGVFGNSKRTTTKTSFSGP